jgi:hypothetical protein
LLLVFLLVRRRVLDFQQEIENKSLEIENNPTRPNTTRRETQHAGRSNPSKIELVKLWPNHPQERKKWGKKRIKWNILGGKTREWEKFLEERAKRRRERVGIPDFSTCPSTRRRQSFRR